MVLLEGEKLFLNVDDPNEDGWVGQWSAAGDMVLHLDYDIPNVKRVRRFLQDFSNLLRVAGCDTMFLLSRNLTTAATNACHTRNSDMLKVFDEMRKGGEITDMTLVPKADAPEELLDLEEGGGGGGVRNSDNVTISQSLPGSPTSEIGEQLHKGAATQPSENAPELSAHRVVLGAAIPYIRDWAKDWKHATSDGVVLMEFNGTVFGAKAVLGQYQ